MFELQKSCLKIIEVVSKKAETDPDHLVLNGSLSSDIFSSRFRDFL